MSNVTKLNPSVIQDKSITADKLFETYYTAAEIEQLVGGLHNSDYLVYKGTVDNTTGLPKIYNAGWVYIVSQPGTHAGKTCEPGDLIVANTTVEANTTNNSHWNVIQTNINGAVTTSELTTDHLVVGASSTSVKTLYAGTAKTGNVLKVNASGYPEWGSVPSHDHNSSYYTKTQIDAQNNNFALRTTPPNNEIWYTSVDDSLLEPNSGNSLTNIEMFGANIISNTCTNGKGVIKFDAPVTKIVGYAFRYSNGNKISSILIPSSVTIMSTNALNLGNDASSTQSVLTKFIVDLNNDNYYSFNNNIIVDKTTNTIKFGANDITTLPDNVVAIADAAFTRRRIKCLNVPDNITTIGKYACDASSIETLILGSGVTSIDTQAFAYNYNLTTIYSKSIVPPSLYDNEVFKDCNTNAKIYVPLESVEAYKTAARWSSYADKIVGCVFNDDLLIPLSTSEIDTITAVTTFTE